MERKIGEIFEYNGEWYQCVKGNLYSHCDFCQPNVPALQYSKNFCCFGNTREDKTSVIFRKLKKVGEPFPCRNMSLGRYGIIVQRYKVFAEPILTDDSIRWCDSVNQTILIALNNKDMKTVKVSKDDLNFLVNKIRYGILPEYTDCDAIIAEITDLFSVEDVDLSNSENIGKNLKPFDLQAAKSGKPVCTRDGRKARIICFDSKNDPQRPIIALVENNSNELLYEYTIKGKDRFSHISTTGTSDLMMLPEKKEGWTNVSKFKIYDSKEEALSHKTDDIISTVKVEWYE